MTKEGVNQIQASEFSGKGEDDPTVLLRDDQRH